MHKIYFIEPDNIQDLVFVCNDKEEVEEITGIEGKKWHCIYTTAFEPHEQSSDIDQTPNSKP